MAEGVRLVEEALAAGIEMRGAVVGPALEATARGKALKAALGAAGVAMHEMPSAELAALADTEHPQGIIAVVAPRRWSLDHIAMQTHDTVLVLDGVQDPGNVGTLVRTAFGLQARAVIALPGTADLSNPKVLRAGMGATFRLPCVAASVPDFRDWVRASGSAVWVAAADGDPLRDAARPVHLAVVVGNEGAGVSDDIRALADRLVAIPLAAGAESLNVAAAAAILLYEVQRD